MNDADFEFAQLTARSRFVTLNRQLAALNLGYPTGADIAELRDVADQTQELANQLAALSRRVEQRRGNVVSSPADEGREGWLAGSIEHRVVDAARRVIRGHPLAYGFQPESNEVVLHSDMTDMPVLEQFLRCPTCEQWSPCDVVMLADWALTSYGLDFNEVRAEVLAEERQESG